jgi:hypothetical protein
MYSKSAPADGTVFEYIHTTYSQGTVSQTRGTARASRSPGRRPRPGGLATLPEIFPGVFLSDSKRRRRLVAANKIVSPANKDRPEHRRAFVAKRAALLQNRVSVSIIDLVTSRTFNLYRDLLELLGRGSLPGE